MGHNRAFWIALAISALFHISMVSIFSIGVWLPVEQRKYYSFVIGPDRPEQLFSLGDLVRDSQPSSGQPAVPDSLPLPHIELTTIEFDQLRRLELRSELMDARERFRELRSPDTGDSWARFGEGLTRIGDAIERLNPFIDSDLDGARAQSDGAENDGKPAGPKRIGEPAPGFVSYIEWLSGDPERDILIAPPIEALSMVDPRQVPGAISLVLRVNPEGQVVEITGPMEKGSLESRVGRGAMRYRFEPLSSGKDMEQHGTLFIAPEENAP